MELSLKWTREIEYIEHIENKKIGAWLEKYDFRKYICIY